MIKRLVVITGLLACTGTPKIDPPMPATLAPFVVSSLKSNYAVKGVFWGQVGQDQSGLRIQIDSLQLAGSTDSVLAATKLSVRPFLAYTNKAGHWDIRSRGTQVSLNSLPTIRNSVKGPFQLSLPRSGRFDSAADYLAFAFEFPDPGNPHQRVTTYACGYPGMLVGSLPTRAFPTGEQYVDAC